MASQQEYLLTNNDKMVKKIWSELLEDYQEHAGGRLHPMEATRPNAALDPFTEPILTPVLADPSKQNGLVFEINGLFYDLDVEEGYYRDPASYRAQRVIALKRFWASTPTLFWDFGRQQHYVSWSRLERSL